MRIILFSTYFYPYTSGLSNYPLKFLTRLVKKHEITVLTFRYQSGLKKIDLYQKIKIVRMPYLFKISKGFISPQSFIYYLKYLRNSDLVILNLPNFEAFPMAFLAWLYKKKILSILLCEVQLVGNIVSKIINFFLDLSVYFQLLLSKEIVTMTQDYIADKLAYKLFKKKIKLVLPPVAKLSIDQSKLDEFRKIKKRSFWLGFVGRISREKGLEHLIKAVAKLSSKIPNLKLVFAGPYGKQVVSENNYYLAIKKLLKKLRVDYIFFGSLSNEQLGAFYKIIDVLILPSLNKTEALGIVQIEAMLAGTPVIASDLPGVRVPVKLTKMGETFDPRNINKLIKVIEKVIKNKKIYSSPVLVEKTQKVFNAQKSYRIFDTLIDV